MNANFERCIAVTLREEDPSGLGKITVDEGGTTRWGIAQRYHPDVDVSSLTLENAKAIYKREYWDGLRCSEMPGPLAMLVLDCAVNPGQGWTATALQRALGVRVDGKIGMETLAAAKLATSEEIAELGAQRILYWASRPTFEKYKLGWMRRAARVMYQAARMETW